MTKTVADEAESLLNLLESDFGQSGRDVQLEAIRCSLDFAYQRGLEHARRAAEPEAELCRHGTTYAACRQGCPPWRVPARTSGDF